MFSLIKLYWLTWFCLFCVNCLKRLYIICIEVIVYKTYKKKECWVTVLQLNDKTIIPIININFKTAYDTIASLIRTWKNSETVLAMAHICKTAGLRYKPINKVLLPDWYPNQSRSQTVSDNRFLLNLTLKRESCDSDKSTRRTKPS